MSVSTDAAVAKVIAWLKRNGWTAHVFASGSIEIRQKSTGALVRRM